MVPELENWKEIDQLLSSDLASKREQGIGKAIQNVVLSVVNSRHAVNALNQNLVNIKIELETLNVNLKAADATSGELTQALNQITSSGVRVAKGALVVSVISLLLYAFSTLKDFHLFS